MQLESSQPPLVHALSIPFERGGVAYVPSACGRQRRDGTWEGWIEFVPIDSGRSVIRTPRETTQSTREALFYWANGLDAIYLDGAFERADPTRAHGPRTLPDI